MTCVSKKATLVSTIISRVVFVATRVLVFKDSLVEDHLVIFFISLIWLCVILLSVHTLINYTGYLFIEKDKLISDNAKLLENLEQGVFILDKDSYKLTHANKAARKVIL